MNFINRDLNFLFLIQTSIDLDNSEDGNKHVDIDIVVSLVRMIKKIVHF